VMRTVPVPCTVVRIPRTKQTHNSQSRITMMHYLTMTWTGLSPLAIVGLLFGTCTTSHAYSCRKWVRYDANNIEGDASSPIQMPRAEFLASVAGSTAFLLGYSEKVNAAQVVDQAEKFQAGLDFLNKESKSIEKAVSKETRKVTKEIKKEVKKIDRTVTKETNKVEKKVKKEVKKMGREIKKDTKMVERETQKIGTVVEQKAQKIGTAVEQKANAIVGGGTKTKMASPPKNTGIDVSRIKLCNDPKSKCL
jgi:hypothetical protein